MEPHQPHLQISIRQAQSKPAELATPAFSSRSWSGVARYADVTGGSGWPRLFLLPLAHQLTLRADLLPTRPLQRIGPPSHRFPAIGSPTCSTYSGQPPSTSSSRPIPDLWNHDRGVCSPGPNNQQDSTFSRKVPAGSRTLVPRFLFRVSGTLQRFPLIR